MNIRFFQASTVRVLFSTLAVAAAGAFLTACDDVDEADRYIKVEYPPIARRVLIQEFTGQGCTNCPQGAALVHSLQEQYPGSIIAVNMHPKNTPYTRPMGGMKLTSELATVYYAAYKPSSLPAAVIDGNAPNSNVNTWTSQVMTALGTEAPADLEISAEFDPATRELSVKYDTHFNSIYTSPLAINVWVMENGLIGPQYSGSDVVRDYEHNHVLRTTLTGDWGVTIADSFIPEDKYSETFTTTLSEEWVAENCQVIAFLQNGSRIVEQSAETDITFKK